MQRRLGIVAILVVALAGTAAGCGGGGGSSAAPAEVTTSAGGTSTAAAGTSAAAGDPAAGKEVFSSQGCATCHTLSAAGATGTTGPNLDTQLQESAQKAGQPLPEFVHTSIVDPNAFIAEGYPADVMPQDLGEKLSQKQIDDLVAFVVQATSGG